MKKHPQAKLLSVIIVVLLVAVGALAQPSPGGGGTNGGGGIFCADMVPYGGPGLKIYQPIAEGTNYLLYLLEAATNTAYDLFFSTNIAPDATWVWVTNCAAGQTSFLVLPPSDAIGFYLAGTTQDTDGDGISDAKEIFVNNTDPYVATFVDSDADGMPDGWESLHGLTGAGPFADSDADSVSDYQEYVNGTDPNTADALTLFVGSPRGTSNLP